MNILTKQQPRFEENEILNRLKKYLPHQAPLKDFVHHNTLSCFQEYHFEEAIDYASKIFGYKTSLNIGEYRRLYKEHLIREDVLEYVIIRRKGKENADEWIHKLFNTNLDLSIKGRIGHYREWWKKAYHVDLDHEINNLLFRLLGSYLDQGIAHWHFPLHKEGFLASVRNLDHKSFTNLIRTKLGKMLIRDQSVTITQLLDILVKDELLFENYLFEQQFSHPGWSGLVNIIESHPESLIDRRPITLEDVIKFELILEIDAIEYNHKGNWKPLGKLGFERETYIFSEIPFTEERDVINIWQEAYEWSYYDSFLAGIQKMKGNSYKKYNKSFQALFCIDDREGSIRRHIENIDPKCETYGTPGHFGILMYYQPKDSNFYTRVCPDSITPKHLVKEIGETDKLKKEIHFSKWSLHLLLSIPYSLLVGFWSGLMMFFNIFKPSFSTMATSSFSHMGKESRLSIEYDPYAKVDEGLQVGFKQEEMIAIVTSVLKSCGLVDDFGTLVYIIGHGSSSINNTHYAGYDCGACSGRPGSVNARVFATMANMPNVREGLKLAGITIPNETQFLGGLHDTTRDEFEFYDESILHAKNKIRHNKNLDTFNHALDRNAKERSRRFFSINTKQPAPDVHQEIRNRSVSLFEPRPELNHANNALCIIGRHSLHEGLFLDRRAFSNSYDYSLDPNGELLLDILKAAIPVTGGINLEYLFSRVDNQKLGAGSKLPHNVIGLMGVINGIEGDVRPGLPFQMIDLHDPIRLMMVVEHFPEVVLRTIKKNISTYQWIQNEWINFTVVHPETYEIFRFDSDQLKRYQPLKKLLDTIEDVDAMVELDEKNFPVCLIKKA